MRCKFFVVLISIFAIFTISVKAQDASPSVSTQEEFNFEKAYKDYLFTQDKYRIAQSDYILARAQYMQADTLASQVNAKKATIAFLESRDDLLVSYLLMLRTKVSETPQVQEVTKTGLFQRIDSEVSWLKSHKSKIQSVGTLLDLTKDSDTVKTRFYTVTNPLAFEVLSVLSMSSVSALRDELNLLISDTRAKVSEIRSAGDHDTNNAERWLTESQNKITRSLDKSIEAESVLSKIRTPEQGLNDNKLKSYTELVEILNNSTQFLREADSHLKEVIKQLRYKL